MKNGVNKVNTNTQKTPEDDMSMSKHVVKKSCIILKIYTKDKQ